MNIAICDDEAVFTEKLQHMVLRFMAEREITCNIDAFASGFDLLAQDVKQYDG